MGMYDWPPRMVNRLWRAFARIRTELDAMRYALRCANLYAILLERELDQAERMLATMRGQDVRA